MLRLLTAGESHGPQLTVVIDGLPAGMPLAAASIDRDLRRRQGGHGRGGRQRIERDRVQILSGVRGGRTLGSPVTLVVVNRDWQNWQRPMQVEAAGFRSKPVRRVRPGHADLAGALKYDFDDARNVLERASARETAARVAAGAVAKRYLRLALGITVHSYVTRIGAVTAAVPGAPDRAAVEASPVRCPDPLAAAAMVEAIDRARADGDTLGGCFRVEALGVPPGLGSYRQWDTRLDGRLAQALCSIQAVKGVEIGDGFAAAGLPGSRVHDEPWYDPAHRRFAHRSNRAGGVTGGISNGEVVWCTVAVKPISTLLRPLRSVDLATKAEVSAHYERSDICVVPAAAVIGEAMMAWVLAEAAAEKFGGDSLPELRRNVRGYRARLRRR
ncbi:MAG TPA: chorismate synthase [Candidatus Micrarchaeia archaeon]|nr:chorismate synthase [Candidatus Micrarchaeia archaeon]